VEKIMGQSRTEIGFSRLSRDNATPMEKSAKDGRSLLLSKEKHGWQCLTNHVCYGGRYKT
jgi:hypothetical protein